MPTWLKVGLIVLVLIPVVTLGLLLWLAIGTQMQMGG